MIKILTTIILLLLFLAAISGLIYWLVTTPKTSQLQPALEERMHFDYETALRIQKDSSLSELLLLRRVRGSEWKLAIKPDYKIKTRKESSMSVTTIRPDAYLKSSSDDFNKAIIGRLTDRGSGMHGWHITMIRQGASQIDFSRHQRYYVWVEKDYPKGFNDKGEPLSVNPKRWFFAGLADIIAKDKYNGYEEPNEGDR